MSIWASDAGIDCWDCKRGCRECDHVGNPYEYGSSATLPNKRRPRSGSVGIAHLSRFVRYYRKHPKAIAAPAGIEPWLRLDVVEKGHMSAVVLDDRQIRSLINQLQAWLDRLEAGEADEP